MRESTPTPIESTLGGYRAVLREVALLRGEVERLRNRVSAALGGMIVLILLLVAAAWPRH